MKIAADTSVLVASFAAWHEHHELAFAAIDRVDSVIAHCLLETFSVLTRLPAPHRMTADVVATYLETSFAEHEVLALSGAEQRLLVAKCAAQGLSGGAIYDALIAATCTRRRARLLTLDARARTTYAALGTAHELLV